MLDWVFGAGFDLTASIEDLAPGTPKKIQISNALSCIDPGSILGVKKGRLPSLFTPGEQDTQA